MLQSIRHFCIKFILSTYTWNISKKEWKIFILSKRLKDNLFYGSVLLILFLTALFLGNFFCNVTKKTNAIANFGDRTIVIDAGHGGEDGGAIGLNDILEKDINLKIAKKLNDTFTNAGFSTLMTRTEDKAIYKQEPGKSKTLRQKKVDDLKNRVNIANSSDKNILVSIHQNKFTNPKYSGTQIFYSSNNKDSELLANFVKEAITNTLQSENKRENKKASKDIYILNNVSVPAIIVECGFLSNEEESKKLLTDDYQKSIANCIFEGVKKFLASKK